MPSRLTCAPTIPRCSRRSIAARSSAGLSRNSRLLRCEESAMTTTTFDPDAYKRTTTEQWQTAAQAWHDWGPVLEVWLGEATERMLDLAGVEPGSKVLDIAAGSGGQSIAAARRVGPRGRVLATDIA